MNICSLIGKITSDIDFKFIVNNKKYYSIAIFQIELNNKSIITVKGYNDIADFCYRKLNKYNNILIKGNINNKFEVNIEEINKETFANFKE